MLGYTVQTVKNFVVLTVKHLAYVTKWRGNVMVDVKMDGPNINVTQVWRFNEFGISQMYSIYDNDSWKSTKDNSFYKQFYFYPFKHRKNILYFIKRLYNTKKKSRLLTMLPGPIKKWGAGNWGHWEESVRLT